MTRVAVVTIAHGRHAHLARQRESLARGSRRPDHHVVVAMDDAGLVPDAGQDVVPVPRHDLGLPLSAARNAGAARARAAGADVLVFLDVDCLAGRDLVATYAEAAGSAPAVVWSGPVTYLPEPPEDGYDLAHLDRHDDPHPARPDPGRGQVLRGTDPDLFWSLSFAVSAAAWSRTGGFCEDYVGYSGEDTDFGHLVVDRGLQHAWHGDARAHHQWHPVSSPPVEHLHDVLRNAALFHARWGWWPMGGWLAAFEELGLAEHRDGRWVLLSPARGRG